MATSTKLASALKMIYVTGTDGTDEITKSRTIANINMEATDENVYGFAEAMLLLQNHGASVSRIDSEILTA